MQRGHSRFEVCQFQSKNGPLNGVNWSTFLLLKERRILYDDRVAEDLTPFGKAAVAGQDHRPFFVASVDPLEEEVGGTVDDQERGSAIAIGQSPETV